MLLMILSIYLTASSGGDGPGTNDARLLIDSIESLQQPVDDFRCEYEGSLRYKGKVAEYTEVGDNGLYESFSGIFVWKRGGDIHSESLHRRVTDNRIARESLVVRMRDHQAEQYHRLNDAPLGYSVIKDPKEINLSQFNCLTSIFLINRLRREVASESFEASVSQDEIEGRPLKVLNIAAKGAPGPLIFRYWVDMRRNGHVVRQYSYVSGNVIAARLDIKLAPFNVGGTEVWMPVYGDKVGYMAIVDKKPVVTKEPTSLETIYIIGSSIEFNKRPGREAFTIKYKLGTPISDNLRKLEYEFGQQKIDLRPSKADAEKMLKEQLAKASKQRSELVVASPSEGFDWASWIAWVFAAVILVSSVVLWIQSRRH